MAPIVNGLKTEYEGTVAIRTYDVDKSEEGVRLANEYEVMFVPTFVFLDSDGEHVDTMIGEMSEEQLREVLDSLD
jgi:thioredoxin-like negative regulator of GroEL